MLPNSEHNDNLLAYFDVGCLRADTRRVHDGGHVDAGATVEESPEEARKERHQRLEQQDERNPLIIVDVRLDVLLRQLFFGDDRLHRQVVGVADPADGVRVLSVTIGELGRTPAGYRLTDELLGGDQRAEADEDDDRVLAVETVDIVVVHTELDLADGQDRLEKALHVDGGCDTNRQSRRTK